MAVSVVATAPEASMIATPPKVRSRRISAVVWMATRSQIIATDTTRR